MTVNQTPGSMGRCLVRIGDTALSLAMLEAAYGRPLRAEISPEALRRLRESRAAVERHVASGLPVYGVNTGFGALCNKRISGEQLARLQANLLISHAVGVGPPVPAELVRWMLWFKISALLVGASGLQPVCVEFLVRLLNEDLLPVVPTRGSLGASGDLSPLAHLVLPLIGEGELLVDGVVRPAAEVLKERGIQPLVLAAKDGLALINGTQMMLAYLAAIIVRARRLARQADIIATMSLEALQGSVRPFDERVLALRPHPGILEVGANVRRLMAESEILLSHADCDKVQDPYSLRCIAHVHGACRDVLRSATATMLIELNAVTDNPVVVDGDIISGGNFHGEPLALHLDSLAMALTEWASMSERRTYLLLSGESGLPKLLMLDTGVNSGFMIPQYTAAALVNECKVLATPACVDSIPTSLGQEDHVSMGATSALKCWQVLEHAETVLAIEMMCAAQGLDYRMPTRPGLGPRAAHAAVRRTISHAEEDHFFGKEIQAALDFLRRGEILEAAEQAIGPLK